jgi:serine/threonine protein kinase
MPLPKQLKMLSDIASGLQYLHTQGVAHGNLSAFAAMLKSILTL